MTIDSRRLRRAIVLGAAAITAAACGTAATTRTTAATTSTTAGATSTPATRTPATRTTAPRTTATRTTAPTVARSAAAGVLARSSGHVTLVGGAVTTTGAGANAVFAYGTGTEVTARATTLTAHGQYAHGAMASGGGRLTMTDVTINTAGGSSAAVATDRGGGTVNVHGGKMITTGATSPGIYSTGQIAVTDATMVAQNSEAAVVEGANSITITDSSLTGTAKRGVMLYQSMSGDAAAGTGTYTMVGGSLTAKTGPAFYVTNEKALITLSGGARVAAASGVLLRADSAGTGSGNTGAGVAEFRADGERLVGALVAAGTGSISATLSDTTLSGTLTHAGLTLQKGSVWTVTGNSTLTTLSGASIRGRQVTNIVGNGHTVTYDGSLAADRAIAGKTYTLPGGGTLRPA